MKNNRNKLLSGFTLIELLVVVVILAILFAIVLIGVANYIKKARDAAMKTDMGQLSALAEKYYNANNESYSGFCQSGDALGLKAAIEKINSNFHFYCSDHVNNSSCPSDKWFAYTSGLGTGTGCWCNDYMGGSDNLACGAETDSCVCNKPH